MQAVPSLGKAVTALMPYCKKMALRSLQLASTQREFIRSLLIPKKIPFAVLKGRALGSCYYPKAEIRYARDIDILVAADRAPELLFDAIHQGYRLYPEEKIDSIDEVRLLSRQTMVTTLLDDKNIPIEVHSHLDKSAFILDHSEMLERRQLRTLDGVESGVLKTEDHLLYICLHHTRHFWSKLNWLADLDALMTAGDFDQSRFMSLAKERGLEATAEACFNLHMACSKEQPFEYASGFPATLELLLAMTRILQNGPATEFEMRKHQPSLDFSYEWQFPKGYGRNRILHSAKKKWRPSLLDYQAIPLPSRWHWLYVPMKPFSRLIRAFKRK